MPPLRASHLQACPQSHGHTHTSEVPAKGAFIDTFPSPHRSALPSHHERPEVAISLSEHRGAWFLRQTQSMFG